VIAIIDYGAGNLRSVAKAFEHLGHSVVVTNEARVILRAPAVVLPGVGAASNTMNSLTALGLVEPIKQVIADGKPFFGVCLGMQVLLDGSEEGGWQPCLGVVPGKVRRLPGGLKVPHMGWNDVRQKAPLPLFEGIPDDAQFYFVHSYYVDPQADEYIAATTDYGVTFCSVLVKGNVVATQFHPEKSGRHGLKLYDNFARLALG
jgi:imidazole glycerol-phosphate synthase subunit HisH